MLLFIPFFGLVTAQSFAALTVLPEGRQSFDIATGVSHLADGGIIIDETAKLTLNAGEIWYKEQAFVEANNAFIEGEFGSIRTPYLKLDIATQILTTQSVSLTYKNLILEASTLTLFLGPDIARLSGNVLSNDPELTADAIIIDLSLGDAILSSPYTYNAGILTLSQDASGKRLQLLPLENETGGLQYSANSVVDEDIAARFEPYTLATD